MSLRLITAILAATGVWSLSPAFLTAQSRTPPPAPLRPAASLLYYENSPARSVETFVLLQQANAGVPGAQHELGYRYLVGRGLPNDSIKAAEWILRAATQNMALAQYNAGILATHAIGVPWNPFTAYSWFKKAAEQEFAAGLFIFGLLHTDGLVVRQDNAKAYALVKASADQGYEQAREVLEEFRRRGFDTLTAAPPVAPRARADSASGLVFLHFGNVSDPGVGDTVLVQELSRETGLESRAGLPAQTAARDTAAQNFLAGVRSQAARGVPEAHMLLGRMYERGFVVARDPVVAAAHYLMANRLDSPRSPAALSAVIRTDAFRQQLLKRAQEKDRDARYVWAALSAIGFDEVIGWEQALRFLTEQSHGPRPHAPSCLELGFWYATGRNVKQDPQEAVELWNRADSLGAGEGLTRIALIELIQRKGDATQRTEYLRAEAEAGSILAQSGYGFSLEQGIGTRKDKPAAATWYRRAAQRGSVSAYRGLKGMYDALRPEGEEFRVEQ